MNCLPNCSLTVSGVNSNRQDIKEYHSQCCGGITPTAAFWFLCSTGRFLVLVFSAILINILQSILDIILLNCQVHGLLILSTCGTKKSTPAFYNSNEYKIKLCNYSNLCRKDLKCGGGCIRTYNDLGGCENCVQCAFLYLSVEKESRVPLCKAIKSRHVVLKLNPLRTYTTTALFSDPGSIMVSADIVCNCSKNLLMHLESIQFLHISCFLLSQMTVGIHLC